MYQAKILVNDNFFEDLEAEMEHERYQRARDALDVGDVLSETVSLMLAIGRDEDHPLYGLVKHCVEHGTPTEIGQMSHMSQHVGTAFLPLIEKAIGRLVQEAQLQDTDDGPF